MQRRQSCGNNRFAWTVCALSALLAFGGPSVRLMASDNPQSNTLTPEEKSAGWQLLFDGKTTQGWRSFRKRTFPDRGWVVENGTLKHVAGAGGGDIITEKTFKNFDFQWDWEIPPHANNGIKYFVTEKRSQGLGHEYQMIDEADVGRDGKHSTASFYDVLPPAPDKPLNPPGQWNHSRVLVQGNHVEHWLNGKKVLEYDLGSDEVKKAIGKSKFHSVPDFGEHIVGHILLTDHHDEASFRNVKIRELP